MEAIYFSKSLKSGHSLRQCLLHTDSMSNDLIEKRARTLLTRARLQLTNLQSTRKMLCYCVVTTELQCLNQLLLILLHYIRFIGAALPSNDHRCLPKGSTCEINITKCGIAFMQMELISIPLSFTAFAAFKSSVGVVQIMRQIFELFFPYIKV